jgi:hypothetical protein
MKLPLVGVIAYNDLNFYPDWNQNGTLMGEYWSSDG